MNSGAAAIALPASTFVAPTLDNVVDSARDYASNSAGFLGKFANGVVNSLPIYSSLRTNDKAVAAAMKQVEHISQHRQIDGSQVWGIMYEGGINNIRTKNTFMDALAENGYTVNGEVKSAHEIEHVGGLGGKLQRGLNKALDVTGASKLVGHLEIYDDFWQNTRISGETQALISATALASLGASWIYAAGSGANGLREATGSEAVSSLYGYGTSAAMLLGAAYSGNILSAARSGAMVAQQYLGAKSKGKTNTKIGKAAKLLGLGLTLSTIGLMASGCNRVGCADEKEHSPFDDMANKHKNEPLWKLLADADHKDGKVDGRVSVDYLRHNLSAEDQQRYSHLFDFDSKTFGGNSDGTMTKFEANGFLEDYISVYAHNFADRQRINHDGADFSLGDDGKFHVKFNDQAKDTLAELKKDPTVGHNLNENDLVVRVFSSSNGTPIAVADIGTDGTSTVLGADILNGIRSGKYIAEASFIDRNGSHDASGVAHSYCPSQFGDDTVHIFGRINQWPEHHVKVVVKHEPETPCPPCVCVPCKPQALDDHVPKPHGGPADAARPATYFQTDSMLGTHKQSWEMNPRDKLVDRTNTSEVSDLISNLGDNHRTNAGHVEMDDWHRMSNAHQGQVTTVYHEGFDGLHHVPQGHENDQMIPAAMRPTVGNVLGLNHNYKAVKHPERYVADTNGDNVLDYHDNRPHWQQEVAPREQAVLHDGDHLIPRWHDTRGHRVREGHDPNVYVEESQRPNPSNPEQKLYDYDSTHVIPSPEKRYLEGVATGVAIGVPGGAAIRAPAAAGGTTVINTVIGGGQTGGPGIVGGQ